MIQLLPGIRIKVPDRHSTRGRVKVKSIQLFLGKDNNFFCEINVTMSYLLNINELYCDIVTLNCENRPKINEF